MEESKAKVTMKKPALVGRDGCILRITGCRTTLQKENEKENLELDSQVLKRSNGLKRVRLKDRQSMAKVWTEKKRVVAGVYI